MSTEHIALILSARKNHGGIFPCEDHAGLEICFARLNYRLIFRYNTGHGSTHAETRSLEISPTDNWHRQRKAPGHDHHHTSSNPHGCHAVNRTLV